MGIVRHCHQTQNTLKSKHVSDRSVFRSTVHVLCDATGSIAQMGTLLHGAYPSCLYYNYSVRIPTHSVNLTTWQARTGYPKHKHSQINTGVWPIRRNADPSIDASIIRVRHNFPSYFCPVRQGHGADGRVRSARRGYIQKDGRLGYNWREPGTKSGCNWPIA